MTRLAGVLIASLLAGSAPWAPLNAAPAPVPVPAGHAQDARPVPAATLSPEAMEAFLKTARIVSQRPAGNGVTNSQRATLSDGTTTHDVHIQVIDDARSVFRAGGITELNFRDSYRYNIAAYRLARLLGLANVPMSVERRMNGKTAAVTWWIDDVQMDERERMKRQTPGALPERVSKQLHVMYVFDELIQNRDRNQGNLLWTSDMTLWLIDHTRAFRLDPELRKPQQLTRCERSLLERLRGLTKEAVAQATDGSLSSGEVKALLARRDALVAHFDARLAALGEAAVLFTL